MNNGIIISLAYPDTIVKIPDERFLSYLRFIGIGKKGYVRAGHAALVLINKATGELEYFDFGRYVTPMSSGRVRSKDTDFELNFSIRAQIKNNTIVNLDEILRFLATNPRLTHGEGKLVASVCKAVDYNKAKTYIDALQQQYFVKYAVFQKAASNCSRFVTETLIASVTNDGIRKKLIKSKWFTPSTVGNVLLSNTEKQAFCVSDKGEISKFKGSPKSENLRCFLDRLKNYQPNLVGSLEPKFLDLLSSKAQWLPGIGSGAWFELYSINHASQFRCRRISPYGTIDVDGLYEISTSGFDSQHYYRFCHDSNCLSFKVEQQGEIYTFNYLKAYGVTE
ncbi:DUF6695 family protein [Psychroserpens damuponensis]|uniref:DUF6695 family protein n=1 Tax=Psychroserpens damuponensis TaxID=943936 RepID=UPI00058B1BA9|nr:DUF6695 family protein [Psychroserpens damuponensis]